MLCLVTWVEMYSFVDEKDRRRVEGGSVMFVESKRRDTDNNGSYKGGLRTSEAKCSAELANMMKPNIPGLFELDVDLDGKGERQKRVVVSASVVAPPSQARFTHEALSVLEAPRQAAASPAAASPAAAPAAAAAR